MTRAAAEAGVGQVGRPEPGPSRYAGWLRAQGVRLYAAAGIEWRVYNGALMPLRDVPRPVDLSRSDARRLLGQSGAWLIRYPGRTLPSGDGETGAADNGTWYYVLCDSPVPLESLAKKVRYEVNVGFRRCTVRRLDPEWLAANGYGCYRAAFARYRYARPADEPRFRADLIARRNAPVEFWGVFVGETLAGYSQCIIDDAWVHHSVAKYHPDFLKDRVPYVMVRSLIEEYAGRQGRVLMNGTRSLSHDTNYNQVLVKLGFRMVACELKVAYQPVLGLAVRTLFPLRHLLSRLPDSGLLHDVRAVLELEATCRASSGPGAPGPAARPLPEA
jgi:hypothetical protein